MAAGRRWSPPTGLRRAALRADLQRARSGDPPSRSPPEPRFAADLGLPRQPAAGPRSAGRGVLPRAGRATCPTARFLLGGNGWDDKAMPPNVRHIGHVYTREHNAFNCSPLAVLNVARDSMAAIGFSPATRVFEAAGAGACLITDAWEGIEQFLEPGGEVLVARDGADVAEHLARADARSGRAPIGDAARAPRAAPSTPTRSAAPQVDALLREKRRSRERRRASRMTARRRLGLSLSSSWGNGHATTYRALLQGASPARPRDPVPRARRALVRGAPRPRRSGLLPARALRSISTSCAALARRRSRDADAVIVGSYVPEGVAVGRLGAAARARRHRLLRHRHAGDARASSSAATCEYLVAGADPGLRPLSVLHRRPDAATGSSASTARRRRGRSIARSIPSAYPPAGPRDALGSRAISAPTAPTGSRRSSAAARAGAAARRTAASWSPARNIPATSPGRPMSSASIMSPPAEHPAFYARSRFTLNVTRADMVARRLSARACGCSRRPPAATPIISDTGPGSTRCSCRAARSLLAERRRRRARRPDRLDETEPRRSAAQRARVLAEHTAAHRAGELEGHIARGRSRHATSKVAREAQCTPANEPEVNRRAGNKVLEPMQR